MKTVVPAVSPLKVLLILTTQTLPNLRKTTPLTEVLASYAILLFILFIVIVSVLIVYLDVPTYKPPLVVHIISTTVELILLMTPLTDAPEYPVIYSLTEADATKDTCFDTPIEATMLLNSSTVVGFLVLKLLYYEVTDGQSGDKG